MAVRRAGASPLPEPGGGGRAPALQSPAVAGWRLSLRQQAALAGYLFLLPNIVGFLVFSSLPVLATLAISTLDWDMIRRPTFVGAENYGKLLLEDATFRRVLTNTAYYVLGTVPTGIVLSL